MLNLNLTKLLGSIKKVERAHLEDYSTESMLSLDWQFIFDDFDGWTILQASTDNSGGYWMYPMLYPNSKIEKEFEGDLYKFNINTKSAAFSHISSGNENHWLEPCWGEEDFYRAELPLFFKRFYYGLSQGKENYVELNQLITHPLDIHWSKRKKAYCSMNSLGEEVEKIKLVETDGIEAILIRSRTLDKLLHLGTWVLVRYFNFRRWVGSHPDLNERKKEVKTADNGKIKFEEVTCGKDEIKYSEFRGVHVRKPETPKEQLLSYYAYDEEDEPQKYASFIVHDWKNKTILEDYSIQPDNFANYYTESDLPFETSILFFNAEVLDKYKNNPDKYEVREQDIICRGGWLLDSYDTNEHYQVHTYAVYLARLPYREQLHWRQYNEKPIGTISERAVTTDFEGKWPNEIPKLAKLREGLEKIGKITFPNDIGSIWSPKGGSWKTAAKGLFYLNTENSNAWHDFIIALTNSINEGFQKEPLFRMAEYYGCSSKKLGTLGLLKFILNSSGNGASVESTHGVLNSLQQARCQGKAHGAWKIPDGSLIEDADQRLDQAICAVKRIYEIFSKIELR